MAVNAFEQKRACKNDFRDAYSDSINLFSKLDLFPVGNSFKRMVKFSASSKVFDLKHISIYKASTLSM